MCVGLAKSAEHSISPCPDSNRDGSFGSSQKNIIVIATFFLSLRQIGIMKKLAILLFVSLTIISCRFGNGNTSIEHSQHSHYYQLTASFNPERTDQVDRYLDKELANGNTIFYNTQMDGELTLDDKTTFYIKKSPGYLKIKFDKAKNPEEAFTKIRSVLERVKW